MACELHLNQAVYLKKKSMDLTVRRTLGDPQPKPFQCNDGLQSRKCASKEERKIHGEDSGDSSSMKARVSLDGREVWVCVYVYSQAPIRHITFLSLRISSSNKPVKLTPWASRTFSPNAGQTGQTSPLFSIPLKLSHLERLTTPSFILEPFPGGASFPMISPFSACFCIAYKCHHHIIYYTLWEQLASMG